MGDSDEEFNDRRRGTDRDKFRRERNDYERNNRDDRRGGRGDWGDRYFTLSMLVYLQNIPVNDYVMRGLTINY